MRTSTSSSGHAARLTAAIVDGLEVVVREQLDGHDAADNGHGHDHASRWTAEVLPAAGCQAASATSSAEAGQRASSSVPST